MSINFDHPIFDVAFKLSHSSSIIVTAKYIHAENKEQAIIKAKQYFINKLKLTIEQQIRNPLIVFNVT